MANLGQTFDSTKVNPDAGFDPLPAGDYIVMIIDSDMKPTKNGAGQYLELSMQVIEGQYANRLIWDRLTLIHQNSKTVEIAQRQLSAICHAVGVMQVQDSVQLHNIPLKVRLKYINDPQYGAKNEVAGYKPAGQAAPGQAPAPQQAPAPAQAAAPAPFAAPQQQGMPWAQQAPAQAPQQQAAPQAPAQSTPPWEAGNKAA
jgi:hypothetical protein